MLLIRSTYILIVESLNAVQGARAHMYVQTRLNQPTDRLTNKQMNEHVHNYIHGREFTDPKTMAAATTTAMAGREKVH